MEQRLQYDLLFEFWQEITNTFSACYSFWHTYCSVLASFDLINGHYHNQYDLMTPSIPNQKLSQPKITPWHAGNRQMNPQVDYSVTDVSCIIRDLIEYGVAFKGLLTI